MLRNISVRYSLLVLVSLAPACGSGGDEGSGAPCVTSSDCGTNEICLASSVGSACAPLCTGSADECGASASCGQVGVMSVNVCQSSSESTNPDTPPDPEEQPKIPCSSDADCKVADSRAICAQFQGVKDCTLPCTVEANCDMPSIAGMKVDFMTCIADEGQSTRKACLPDIHCFSNPMDCVTFDPTMPQDTDFGF